MLFGGGGSTKTPQPIPYSGGQPLSFLSTGPDSYVDAYTGVTYRWSGKGARWKPTGQMSAQELEPFLGQARTGGGPFSFTQPATDLLQQYYESFVKPEVQNYYTAAGLGRSGATGEALARAGTELSWQDLLRRQNLVTGGFGQAPVYGPQPGGSGQNLGAMGGQALQNIGGLAALYSLGRGGSPSIGGSPYLYSPPSTPYTGPSLGLPPAPPGSFTPFYSPFQ